MELINIEEEPDDQYGNTIMPNENNQNLFALNAKHDDYAEEIEKIKQMIEWLNINLIIMIYAIN